MTKRILSVILVLTVFFGGYTLIPKKYNLLPVNDAICATNYGGVYKVRKTFKVTPVYLTTSKFKFVGDPITFKAGQIINLTRDGKLSTNKYVDMSKYVNGTYMYLMYR